MKTNIEKFKKLVYHPCMLFIYLSVILSDHPRLSVLWSALGDGSWLVGRLWVVG